jgi:predicted O-linked N-acetylglucosamine transferase (SPINDLY family)
MNPQLQIMLQQAFEYMQQAKFSQAKPILTYVLKIQPKNFDVLHALGFISGTENNHPEAVYYSLKALKIKPDDLEANINCARALQEIGEHLDSVRCHQKAIFLSPNNHEIWLGCGKSLQSLRRYDEAIAHYDKALSLKPDFAAAWSNKGNTFYELKRYDEAIAHYDRALNLNPDFAAAWFNKGIALHELKRYDEAIAHYDKALTLNPDIDWIFGNLLHTKMNICSWSGLAEALENISKKVVANDKVINPFPLLALNDDALLHKKSSEIYIQARYPFNDALGVLPKYSRSQKIRVGYFSADFRHHAVSILAAELFELHDKNRFEIIAFSFGADDKSPMRLRLSKAFNQFIDVSGMSDLDIARLSRDLKIDIAVDLSGYTSDSRTGLFSYRAAPIQVSYLGYLGTMGAEYVDYILADKTIIPDGSEPYYSEKIAYLPSYQVNDRKRVISDKVFTRRELGLPEKGFVFCCFNNNYKILPITFDGWVRILKAVEGSVLFLYAENQLVEENLKKEAEVRGINGARLVFGRSIPADQYLARYRTCDLFLDTTPYNAGTTASDALWTGVPILTLLGQSFAGRMAGSLLNAIGLPELITRTQEEYEALAIELALNPKRLADTKLKLANNRSITPLFDTPLFTKNLEAAYIKMYERYRADLQPDHIFIA